LKTSSVSFIDFLHIIWVFLGSTVYPVCGILLQLQKEHRLRQCLSPLSYYHNIPQTTWFTNKFIAKGWKVQDQGVSWLRIWWGLYFTMVLSMHPHMAGKANSLLKFHV
jgi:hypothetical protein